MHPRHTILGFCGPLNLSIEEILDSNIEVNLNKICLRQLQPNV